MAPADANRFPIDATAILESMGDAFYALDSDWRLVYANQRALRFWKVDGEQVLGRVIWDCLPQLRGTLNEQVLRRVRTEQQSLSFEAPSPTTGIWVAVTVCPAGDGVAVYWRDINDRIRSEQALRGSEEHLRLAQEAGGIGTWEWDLATGHMQWSAQMFRVLGIDPDGQEAGLPTLLAAVHPDDRAEAADQLQAFRSRPGPLRMEVRVRWPSGETRWIVFLGRVITDASDHPARMLGITIDGTSRRAAEERVRADAERLRLALSAGGLATWEYDLQSELRRWSAEAAVMHGFPPEATEMPRTEWTQFIHPGDRERVREEFRAALAGGGDYAAEYRVLRPDGIRWTAVHGSVLRDALGRPVRVVGVMQDVTERKATEARLLSLNSELEQRVAQEVATRQAAQARAAHAERMQALGQLAGGIAHDFNNVLQAVTGAASLIERRPDNVAAVRRYERLILEAAARGSSITRRLLAFAHRDDLRAEPVDVQSLLDGMREILAHTLGAQIRVLVETETGLPRLFADQGQLETVLVNLATNARDAMPDGGTLRLTAAVRRVSSETAEQARPAPGQYVAIEVVDTGTGMDRATLARASEPFFTTKRRGEGTGLGLAMARGFAEQSGGAIQIESRPGAGTRVTLLLPVANPAAETTGSSASECAKAPERTRRILLADDDPLVRDTLTAQLQDSGYAVVAVADGTAALAWLESGTEVDCVVADLSMPGLDGLSLVREVQWRRPRLPAVLLTGFAGSSAALAVGGALSGAFSLLRKPVQSTQLVDRIEMLLEAASVRG